MSLTAPRCSVAGDVAFSVIVKPAPEHHNIMRLFVFGSGALDSGIKLCQDAVLLDKQFRIEFPGCFVSFHCTFAIPLTYRSESADELHNFVQAPIASGYRSTGQFFRQHRLPDCASAYFICGQEWPRLLCL